MYNNISRGLKCSRTNITIFKANVEASQCIRNTEVSSSENAVHNPLLINWHATAYPRRLVKNLSIIYSKAD